MSPEQRDTIAKGNALPINRGTDTDPISAIYRPEEVTVSLEVEDLEL
jgi:hypothetical protein